MPSRILRLKVPTGQSKHTGGSPYTCAAADCYPVAKGLESMAEKAIYELNDGEEC